MTRVLAVCKNSLFIKGIQAHLGEHNIEIVSICNNSYDGLEEYKKTQPDIVLMDANWSANFYSVSGTELIQNLRTFDPAVKIIISTNIEEYNIAERLKAFKIRGYFYRSMDNVLPAIINCIRKV